MGANDNVVVRIVGDASGVPPAVQETAGALGGLEPLLAELNAQMKALTAQMAMGFNTGAASAKKLAVGIEEAKVAAAGASVGFGGMVGKIHEGAESIRTFQMRAKAFAEVYVAMFAVDRIAEWIGKMGEAAEKVQHLSQQFGMSTGQVQQLQGIATATGISIDALTRGMAFLDRNMANAAMGSKNIKQAMDAVGVSFNDGRTQMQKLATVADRFKNMDDGPKKVALAMQLFGKSGRELIPILNLGSQGIEQLNKKMQEYGVVNEAAVAKGVALAESVNESKLGFMGIGNVLTDALAPVFKIVVDDLNKLIAAFVQSYKEGGIVAIIFTAISTTIQEVVAVLEALGAIFSAIWDIISEIVGDIGSIFEDVFGVKVPGYTDYSKLALNEFKDVITIVKDAIVISLSIIGGAFRVAMQIVVTFGKIAWDALHLNWGAIQSDWSAGMAKVGDIVAQEAKRVEASAAEMAAAIQAAAHGEALPGSKGGGLALPKGGSGSFDYNPTGGGGKNKKGKDDLVQKLEQELEAKKAAWEKEQLAQDTAEQFSLESEAAFWDQALKRHNLSAKDRFEITKKWIAAEKALQSDRIAAVLDADKKELFEADKNAQAKLRIVQKERDFIVAKYKEGSNQARAADMAVLQAARDAEQQQIAMIEAVAKARQEAANDNVDEAQANAEFEEQMGLISKGKLLQQERLFEQQRYQIDLQALIKRRSLIDPQRDPEAYQQASIQIEQMERQHQAKLSQIDRQAALQRTSIARQAIGQVAATFGDHISKMITLQEGWKEGLVGIYQGLVQTVASVLQQIIEKWIAAFLIKLIFGKQETGQEVLNQVALAGAGGVASMAAAPFPINLTAPAFGAGMAAAAAAAGAVAGAEGGDWDVSEGLYHLHENEMVLPSWAASPLRDMVSGGGSGGSGGSGSSGVGDIHFHSSPTFNGNQGSLWQQMVNQHGREMRRWVKREANNGAFAKKAA